MSITKRSFPLPSYLKGGGPDVDARIHALNKTASSGDWVGRDQFDCWVIITDTELEQRYSPNSLVGNP
jgi:hypothetical protein